MDENGGKQRPGQKSDIGRALRQAAQLGVTSLHEAVRKGDEEVAHGLLLQRADPNARDVYGMTPLHIAAIEGHADIVRLLLYSGAKPECENVEGFTAAQLTKREDIKEMIHGATGAGMNER
jgi:ankyrin repeat protein